MMESTHHSRPILYPADPTTLSSRHTHRITAWFVDSTITKYDDIQHIRAELTPLIDTLMIFYNVNECVHYLNQIKDQCIILIVGESNGEQLVRRVLFLSKLHSIYILCSNRSNQPGWISVCRPIRHVLVDLTSLCDRIRMESEERDNGIAFDVLGPSSTLGEAKNKQEARFMYGQLLKDVLTGMSYSDDDMEKMIEFFREKYKNQPKSLEKILEFRESYSAEKALWCYTKYLFLYTTLNAALRICDHDAMCTMGIVIKDMHHQLVDLHSKMPAPKVLTLYRGIRIPISIFEKQIKGKEGGLLSTNEFMSTSLDINVARMFADGLADDHASIIFQINIDQSFSTNVSYANLQSISQFVEEVEYVFTMGSVFRIESIEQRDENAGWCVQLSLTTGHDVDLTSLTNYYRTMLKQPSLLSLCFVMCTMGDYEKCVQICETAIKTTNERSYLQPLYMIWGMACAEMGDTRKATEKLELASACADQLCISNENDGSTLLTKCVTLVLQENYDLALSLISMCVEHEQRNPSPYGHQEILAGCQQLTGHIFWCQGRFSDARTNATEPLQRANEHFTPLHPMINHCLQQLAVFQVLNDKKDQALFLMQQATETSRRAMLPEHPLAVSSNILSSILGIPSVSDDESLLPQLDQWVSERTQNLNRLLLQTQLYLSQQRFDEALLNIDQLLSSEEENHSLQYPYLIAIYACQGQCYYQKKNLSKALESYRKAEQIATSYMSHTNSWILAILASIACIHIEQNNDDEAFRVLAQYSNMVSSGAEHHSSALDKINLKTIGYKFCKRGLNHEICGEYQDAMSEFENCLKTQLIFLPNDHPELVDTYKYIADCFFSMKKYSHALINHQKALVISQKSLPSDNPKISEAWRNVGNTHLQLKQYKDALIAFTKYTELFRSAASPDYSKLSDTYQSMGIALLAQGNVIDAIANYEHALDIHAKYLSATDLKVAAIWKTLGYIYRSQKKNDDALIAFNHALEIQMSTLTPNPIDLANIYKEIGIIHLVAGEYSEALPSLQKCLEIQTITLPEDDHAFAQTHEGIGAVLMAQERYSDARSHFQRALDRYRKYLPETDLKVAAIWKTLGYIYRSQKKNDDALIAFNHALEIQMSTLTPNPIDLANIYKEIGIIHLVAGEYSEALPSLQKCLEIQTITLPEDDHAFAQTHEGIGAVLMAQERYSDARSHFQRALDGYRKYLPETDEKIKILSNSLKVISDRPDYDHHTSSASNKTIVNQSISSVADSIGLAQKFKYLSGVAYRKGELEEALSHLEQCLQVEMALLPMDHLDLAETLRVMGDITYQLKRFPDALRLFQRTLQIQIKYLPRTTSALIESWTKSGHTHRELHQHEDSIYSYEEALELQLNILPADHIDIAVTYRSIALVRLQHCRK